MFDELNEIFIREKQNTIVKGYCNSSLLTVFLSIPLTKLPWGKVIINYFSTGPETEFTSVEGTRK